MHTITTIGQLKKSGYQTKTIKQELRDNLIASLKSGKKTFNGIIGYDTSVIPATMGMNSSSKFTI